ncbi:MAG: hypothetical protein K2K90_06140 [Lachnospiraceae bacterium]|nr:hypothetical protein [Lachnospiraceae bacterium]
MVTLFEGYAGETRRQSSKGNQLKWYSGEKWYKADYTGYEGLAEYMVSRLLQMSTMDRETFLLYDTVKIRYGEAVFLGCESDHFQPPGWHLITLERLFFQHYGESLYESIFRIREPENRAVFLVEQTENLTGLKEFGKYLSILLTIDALFLNEDRHTHNIAVLRDAFGKYHYCPAFDHGASLMADTKMDYPLETPLDKLYEKPKAKTFCRDFDEQLDVVENLFGQHLQFRFTNRDVEILLEKEPEYPAEIKKRVGELIRMQRRKYRYLFGGAPD